MAVRVHCVTAPEIVFDARAGIRPVWAPVSEGAWKVVAPVPIHLADSRVPVQAGSDSTEYWDFAVELCDRS